MTNILGSSLESWVAHSRGASCHVRKLKLSFWGPLWCLGSLTLGGASRHVVRKLKLSCRGPLWSLGSLTLGETATTL